MLILSPIRLPITLIMLVLATCGNVALASHTLNPACGNLTLDPTGLGGSTETFDGCLLTGANNPEVGVVLLHGRTSSPDGPVVNELRTRLHTAGYTTLSIENPAADAATDTREFADYKIDAQNAQYAFPETYARVKAAINHLQGLGVTKVVVIGFSMGSRLGSAAVARIASPNIPITGLVGIGMYNNSDIDPLDHDFTLDEVTVPVLDIYGDTDTAAVDGRVGRVNSYNAGSGMSYTQVVLDCDAGLPTEQCHQLVNLKGTDSAPLETTVYSWMTCNAPLVSADCSSAPAITSDGTVSDSGSSSDGGGNMSTLALASLALCALLGLRRRI